MINIESLSKYQQHLLDINSSNYKFNLLNRSIDYINNSIIRGDFDFLNISDEVSDMFINNNYFYDYLENKLTYFKENYFQGYNELNIEALLSNIYTPDSKFVIHDDMFLKLDNIYKKYFSNISEYSIYSIFHNNFKIETLFPSNYVKTCFNKEKRTDLNYKIAFFYIFPMYNFSKYCTSQILTSIKRSTHRKIVNTIHTTDLSLTNIEELYENLTPFILTNIFNGFKFNDSCINEVTESINLDGIVPLFDNYLSTLPTNNFIKCANSIYIDIIQDFSYLLMTVGRENNIIKFNTPETIYKNLIFGTETKVVTENPYIINLISTEIISIVYKINNTSYFIRINNIDYKISRDLMPITFNILNNMIINNSNLALSQILVNYHSSEANILEKTNLTKENLINLISNTPFTIGAEEEVITKLNSIYNTLNNDIIKRIDDIRSIITITYKYRDIPLQFINSNLAVFNDWTDKILDTQYDNIDYISPLTNSDISTIIGSIEFNNDLLLDFINNEFMNFFKNSKTIELNVYNYISQLVDNFIKTEQFKQFVLNDFIEPIALSLKNRSPKLYKEIYQNIDNVINYIKYLLIIKIYNDSDLTFKYRDILNNVEITNFSSLFLENIINAFKKFDSATIKVYKNEMTKFVTSMSVVFFLDKYIDGFRLVKKFGKKSDFFRPNYL